MTAFEKIRLACLVTMLALLSPSSYSQSYPFDTIMNRINADVHLSDGSNTSLDGKVLSARNSMNNNDSSWSDVNYSTGDGNHLVRVTDLARAYTRSSSTYFNSPDIYNCIVKAMWYWYRRNPVNSNWWFNEISFPQQIGRILILMRYTTVPLPATLESNFVVRMTKGNPYAQTGANKTDIALHFLYRSCLVERTSLLDTAATQSFEPIRQNNGGEELQYDNSYFQHGSQLAIASYGAVYVNNAYTVANYLRGTNYALSAARLALLSKFNIDTYNNTIRGKYFDFSVVGRGISRAGATQAGSSYYRQKLVDPANNASWDAAVARISQQQPPSYMVTPLHTHYWQGDYDLHQRPGYLFTVRTVSTRTVRTERGNNENIFGKFLPDGGTAIMRTGAEYFNIFPLWEWDKVPGVTSRNFSADQPVTVDWGQQGNTSFVGGVSDSLYGASVYEQNYNSVTVKKAWFFFDNEVVCLGAGINSTQPEPVTTTLNQSWLKGDVYTSANGPVNTLPTNTSSTLASPQWVLHDSIGYFFPAGGNATVSNEQQSGNWYTINQGQTNAVVTGNVFKLWLDHGTQPVNAKYAYIVAPGIPTVADMQSYPLSNFKIIVNSDSIQAVRNQQQQILQAVFYKAGTLIDESIKITVDKPCVVMLRQLNSNQVPVWVADPAQTNSTVTISLEVPQISGRKMLVAQLPQSPYAGATTRLLFDSTSPAYTVVVPPLPDSLIAVADAYVRDGSSAGTNFGSVTGLPVKKDGTGFSREAYFKFDLHGVRLTPDSAKLRLYCTGGNTTAATTQWALYKINSNSWTETGINWNNKPTTGTLVASRQGQTAAGFVDWDISSLMAGIGPDSLLTLRLISTVTGSTTDASFTSKEGSVERRPAILLKYNHPPSVTINSPLDNTEWEAVTSLLIEAGAEDKDGTISKVEFFLGETRLGEILTVPYNFEWVNAAPGNYTIKVVATDGYGKTSEPALVRVTVKDNTPPVITSPAAQTYCFAAIGQYTAPVITATDLFGIRSVAYAISGATSRNGTGADASGDFNPGISVINWTVTDVHGNIATSQTGVTINQPLSVTVADVYAVSPGGDANTIYKNYGPSSLRLTGVANGGTAPYSYAWNNAVLTSENTVNPSGEGEHAYSVTVTDALGCTATVSKNIRVVDIGCKNGKVTICHKTQGNHNNSLCISAAAVANHLSHGCHLGACETTLAESAALSGTLAQETGDFLVSVYPNPAPAEFKLAISGDTTKHVNVTVFDMQGRIIQTIRTTTGVLYAGKTWRPGLYLIELQQDGKRVVLKLIKL